MKINASAVFFGFAVVLTLLNGNDVSAAEGTSSTAITIYSTARPGAIPAEWYRPTGADRGEQPPIVIEQVPGYAIVKQERELPVEAGRSTVRFTDVAAYIEPTTVTFASLTDPAGTRVLEQNFQFDLVSTAKLLQRYLDREITVDTSKGVLLSSGPGNALVLREGTEVRIINSYTNIRVPELPGGLITKPTLVWDIMAEKGGAQRARVTYETKGVTWWTDYNIVFNEGTDANSGVMDLGAWVSILNQSGATYPEAKVKLIAGDVHRAPQPPMARRGRMEMKAGIAMAEDAGFEEKAFFEYHLYTLGRPTTLPDRSTKQIELFPVARNVPCEKVLVYYGLAGQYFGYFSDPMVDRNFGLVSNKKVDIYLHFKNSKDIGLGMPFPSGRIRVSKLDSADKTLEFIGEDVIDHTAKDEEVLIRLGSAFDVVGERKQIDFKVDTVRHWIEETIEITLRNHKDTPVKVIAKENLYRWTNWEIRDSSHKYEKADSRTIHFPVHVEKDGEVKITYKVRYTW